MMGIPETYIYAVEPTEWIRPVSEHRHRYSVENVLMEAPLPKNIKDDDHHGYTGNGDRSGRNLREELFSPQKPEKEQHHCQGVERYLIGIFDDVIIHKITSNLFV